MKIKGPVFTGLTGVLTMGLLAVLAGCTAKSRGVTETPHYSITSPLRVDTAVTKEYVSQIQSVRNIEIRAQEKGYLQSINVDEGQYVHAGQLLFRIMPTMYEAELQKAQAEERSAALELGNTKLLADKNIVSANELALATAKLDAAKAERALAQVHLSFTEIRAPFDGTIDRIPLKTGSLVDEGALLTSLSDNKSVFAYFNVAENEYLDIQTKKLQGQKQEVSLLLANNQPLPYKGVVETVEGVFNNETGNIGFRARFPNPDLLLRHGETGKVEMTVPLHEVLIIPQKATYEIQDKVYVYVVDKNNVLHSRPVTISYTLPDVYVISDGLSDKDRILLEGVQTVRDDDRVACTYLAPKQVMAGLQLIKQ